VVPFGTLEIDVAAGLPAKDTQRVNAGLLTWLHVMSVCLTEAGIVPPGSGDSVTAYDLFGKAIIKNATISTEKIITYILFFAIKVFMLVSIIS
jgi:hypothetical protein